MTPRRRLQWLFTALLLVALGVGAAFAQDQDQGQNQDQGGYPPPPPDATAQQNYPNQGGAQNYPGQPGAQNYPGQHGAQGQQQVDPPGRVARVQYMSGEVSTQPGGVNDWIAASMNRPLTTSDRIWTDKNSKAELNVGDGFVRMSSETSLTLTNVSDGTVQMELDQGTLSLTVRHLEKGEIYEVDTPNYAFTVTKSGTYRFDVFPSQDQSWVTVRSGAGEATGKGAAVKVTSGSQVQFKDGNSLQHMAYAAPARDGFEDWAQVRDKQLGDSLSARYVSPGVIGYQDLDAYGSWNNSPNYGPVWTPNSVPAGWAPYRNGHWAWIAPWGWTWIDDAPWGFAPYHYGRWVSYGGGWGWSPGPLGYWNPYYAPALVGWVGGPGFGVGFGWGGGWGGFGIGIGFGWFPLGWGQPYYPRYCGWGNGGWYRGGGYVTGNYFRNVNVTNTHITNINNVTNNYYHNNTAGIRATNEIARNGVTSASRSAFTSGAAVNKVGGAVPASALNNAHLLNSANVNPTKSSVMGGQGPRTTGVPSSSVGNRSVVTRATPPSTRPAGFEGNQSTAGHNNAGSLGHGASTPATATNNAVHSPLGANSATTRPSTNGTEATRGATGAAGSQTQARVNTPESSTGHSVPRPPAGNDSFARSNGNPANPGENRGATTAGNQHYGANNTTAARPSQSSTPNRTTTASARSGGTGSVPRPPAGYSYHAAPASGSSSAYGARSPYGYSGGSSRGSYGSSPSYGASRTYSSAPGSSAGRSYGSAPGSSTGRGSYGSAPGYSAGRGSYGSTPGNSAGRSTGSAPTYSARSYGASPSFGRSAGSYSAPHSSGGGSYHGGGGGGSHGGGGGGGGHSGGGGGHR